MHQPPSSTDMRAARAALQRFTVTPSGRLNVVRLLADDLPRPQLLGPALLLACAGGPYAERACSDLFLGWRRAVRMP